MLSTLITSLNALINVILIGLVRIYRLLLSPYFGKYCRFDPTCSVYTLEALERFGPWKGGWLSAKRLCKCHPFGGYGFDPVPRRVKNAQLNPSSHTSQTDTHQSHE